MVVAKRDWKVSLSIALLSVLTFVCVGAASMAAWWTWGPVTQPFEYVNHGSDHAVVEDGSIVLHRTLTVRRRVELHITRELVRIDGQQMTRIRLPESRAVYDPGVYDLRRVLELPTSIAPGMYAMDSVVHWQANLLRDVHLRLPPVTVVVP